MLVYQDNPVVAGACFVKVPVTFWAEMKCLSQNLKNEGMVPCRQASPVCFFIMLSAKLPRALFPGFGGGAGQALW